MPGAEDVGKLAGVSMLRAAQGLPVRRQIPCPVGVGRRLAAALPASIALRAVNR